MHLEDFILGPFELNDPCMNVKFATLCIKGPLGGQIYDLNALRTIISNCIVLDKGGLGESFMGLSESGCIFHKILSVYGPKVKIEGPSVV